MMMSHSCIDFTSLENSGVDAVQQSDDRGCEDEKDMCFIKFNNVLIFISFMCRRRHIQISEENI